MDDGARQCGRQGDLLSIAAAKDRKLQKRTPVDIQMNTDLALKTPLSQFDHIQSIDQLSSATKENARDTN